MRGDVMIDFLSFLKFQPEAPVMGTMTRSSGRLPCSCSECCDKYEKMYLFIWDHRSSKKRLADEQLLFCPPCVLGYAMKIKKWVQLLVRYISDPEEASSKIFVDLQLEEDSKTMIKSLVMAHEEGKCGEGRIRGS